MKTIGQVAYEAYCGATNWKSLVSGADLPHWAATAPEIQSAWQNAGRAVYVCVEDVRRRDRAEPEPPTENAEAALASASVKVMRSYDYCHFEIALSVDQPRSLDAVDELRKAAARLADKAVAQYKAAKANAERLQYGDLADLERQLKQARVVPESERTPEQKATLKAYQDRLYDYQDNWEEGD